MDPKTAAHIVDALVLVLAAGMIGLLIHRRLRRGGAPDDRPLFPPELFPDEHPQICPACGQKNSPSAPACESCQYPLR